MKKITFPKRCLALLLSLTMVISGVTISKKNATAAEETQEQSAVVTEIPVSTTDEFKSALSTANTSEDDVVIKLLDDIEIDTVSIVNDVTIDGTVDGNKHTITLKNGYHGIQLDSMCTVELKNLNIKHQQAGVAVVINDAAAGSDVKMTDVYIDATQPADNYNWAIINIHGNDASKQTKLTLSNVDIDMKASALSNNANKAILRTGNDGATKNVLISLDNCEWDATEATERSGIAIMSGTTATVNINNSTISTKDACPVLDCTGSATITKTNSQFSCTDYEAQVGTKLDSFTKVLSEASAGTTIELLKNITVGNIAIAKNITVDGNGHTITLKDGYHGIQLDSMCTVELKNLNIKHQQAGVAVVINDAAAGSDVKMTDVYIDATQPADNYNWAIINIHGNDASKQTKLTLSNVDIDMKASALSNNANKAILRTGNDGATKNVLISLDNCEWDATEATERSGIAIMSGTTATVNINNSTISTKDAHPILDCTGSASITKTNSTFTCTDAVAQIGETPYFDFSTALNSANAGDTITLQKDVTIATFNITKNLTIDGNGKTLTFAAANDSNHGITVNAACTLELKNMDIVHNKAGSITQIYSAGADVRLTNVKVYANTAANYTHALFNMLGASNELVTKLSLDKVTVTMATEGTASDNAPAIIRTGNSDWYDGENLVSQSKKVEITIKNSTLDTSGAASRYGIIIMDSTTATVNLESTTINTKDVAAIRTFATALSQTVTMSECTLNSGTAENTVQGYQVLTGSLGNGTAYTKFDAALDMANASPEDVTIQLISDVTLSSVSILKNSNDKKIVIDGNGHKMTTASSGYVFSVNSHVEFMNMTIQDRSANELLYIETAGKDIFLTDVTIQATEANYNRSLINAKVDADLYLTNVIVDMDAAAYANEANKAIIRTGNDDNSRTVNIQLDNCNLDTTGATGRSGIVIMAGTTSTITLNNSTIATKDVSPILDRSGKATINNTESTLTCADAVAQIGDKPYMDFATALSEASAGSTIELLKDINVSTFSITKNLTINGNGNTITAENGTHAITVNAACTLELKNMEIVHKQSGSVIQIYFAGAEVKLTNVTIDATKATNYTHALINMLGVSNELVTKLSLDTVTATMATEGTPGDNAPAIIRTGNSDWYEGENLVSQSKKVEITIKNSTLDTSGAASRYGIVIMNSTTATVDLESTTINTKDVAAIRTFATALSQTVTMSDCTLDSGTAENTLQGYQALTGSQGNGTAYTKFDDARVAANASEDDITIGLLSGITVTNAVFNNTNGRKITFDGNGHEVRAQGTSYIFPVNSDVEFRDMTITHAGTKEIIYIETADTTLSLINVTINATSANYERSLINAKVDADLYLTNVIVDMDAAAYANEANKAIIRTGNDGNARTVNIKLDNCNLDTTGATGRSGIVIMAGTTSTITLNNSSIATKDSCPILDLNGSTTILKTKSSLSCTDKVAQVGTTLYDTFPQALEAANNVAGDVTIDILADGIIVWQDYTLGKATGKFTIDGNEHQLSTANGNNAFKVDQVGDVEFKNMTIQHTNQGSVIQITKENAVVRLTDVVIDATQPASNFNWALINMTVSSKLYLTRVNVDMDVTTQGGGEGDQSAVIRTGNAEGVKNIVIQLDASILDATGALRRSGILIVDADASIVLANESKILTQSTDDCAAIRGYTGTKKAAISISKDSLLQSGDSTAKKDTIKNLDKGSGVSDGCTWISQEYKNVTTFRTSNGLEAPNVVPTGYVFAGWFTDKQCTKENALPQEDITTTSAYAKFVPAHVLSVKAQISVNLFDENEENNDKGDIRFVTSVDSLDYQKVGFKYNIKFNSIGTRSGEKSSNVVYDQLVVVGSNGTVSDLVPEQLFCEVSEWFKAFTVTGVSSEDFASEFTIQPFWITLDGTKVYGQEVTKTINEGIKKSNWVDEDGDGDVSETPETTYTNRVVLVSDMHYTTNLTREEYNNKNKLHLWWHDGAGASYAAGPAFGYSQAEKIQCILDDIDALQTSGKNVDSVMVLGDLTLDDYGYRQLTDWYTIKFKSDFMDKLSIPCYAIPGNHDSYTNADWKSAIGTDRQYSVKVGDAAFIMLDTFAATTATEEASGSKYEGVDIDWLKEEVNKYPTEQIFLCSHYYEPSASDTEFNKLLAENDRIVCMFRGHSHINGFYTSSGMADNALFDIGGYAYNGMKQDDGSYEFNTFDPTWAWGYQVLEWNDTEVHTYHVKPARTYTDCNGVVIDYAGAVENDMVIRIGQ